ncbi:MAG: hypothetical protein OXL34_10175 [Gemmatimonadota bacterium]|nr:hypothetical protein [Gemmatimonadota bacterium]
MNAQRAAKPVILVVDDEADELRSGLELRLADEAELMVRHPQSVEPEDLGKAHLVLMDYRLEDWPEREVQPAAFNIRTGLALATVLREAADERANGHLTAVALHTGHLGDVSGRIRPPYSRHVVARLNNLEWVFEKSDPDRFQGVVQLACAAQGLARDWPVNPSASEARARELLKLDDEDGWAERAWREVRECQPPLYELAGHPHGALFLRWLLHQILPYPCFLWDVNWVAARLRLRVDDLERLMDSDCELARDMEQLKYAGVLAGFLGDRWWRTAMEDYAWTLGGESSERSGGFEIQLREKAGEAVELVATRDPVVCLDQDFRPLGVASPHDAVKLRPDHWPPFADAAWMKIEELRSDRDLRALVEPLDQYRIDSGE